METKPQAALVCLAQRFPATTLTRGRANKELVCSRAQLVLTARRDNMKTAKEERKKERKKNIKEWCINKRVRESKETKKGRKGEREKEREREREREEEEEEDEESSGMMRESMIEWKKERNKAYRLGRGIDPTTLWGVLWCVDISIITFLPDWVGFSRGCGRSVSTPCVHSSLEQHTHNLRKGTVSKTLFRPENRLYVRGEHSQTP